MLDFLSTKISAVIKRNLQRANNDIMMAEHNVEKCMHALLVHKVKVMDSQQKADISLAYAHAELAAAQDRKATLGRKLSEVEAAEAAEKAGYGA